MSTEFSMTKDYSTRKTSIMLDFFECTDDGIVTVGLLDFLLKDLNFDFM